MFTQTERGMIGTVIGDNHIDCSTFARTAARPLATSTSPWMADHSSKFWLKSRNQTRIHAAVAKYGIKSAS